MKTKTKTKSLRPRAVDATVPVSVRVSRSLADRLAALRDQASRQGLVLDTPRAISEALEKFARVAERDLAAVAKTAAEK